MGTFRLLMVYLSWFAFLSPGIAENIFIGASEYVPIQETRHDQFTISLSAIHKEGRRLRELECLLAFKDSQNFYRLKLSNRKANIYHVTNGQSREVKASRGRFLFGSKVQEIQIRRADHLVSVAVNGTLALHFLDEKMRGGKLLVRLQTDLDITRFRYLPAEPIVFSDDFMVTAEQKLEDTGWKQIAGEWKLRSVSDRVRESTDPRVIQNRGRREPEPERSANPFSLLSEAAQPSLIVTGFPHWANYYVETSAKTDGGRMGLVFGYRGPEDYFLLRFTQRMPFPSATTLELVRRSGEEETVLGTEHLVSRAGNWYRLHARIIGDHIRAGVDGVVVFDVRDKASTGGKIGLFASEGRCNFDDVLVRTDESVDFDTAESIEGCTRSGAKWDIAETDERRELHANGSGFLFLGQDWKGFLFEANVLPHQKTKKIGIGLGGEWAVSLALKKSETRFTVSLEELNGDGVVPHTVEVPGDTATSFALDLTEQGLLKVYVNNRLEYRRSVPDVPLSPYLYCEGVARFANVRLFGQPDRELERSPRRDLFANDPFMQGWASNRWSWLPVIRSEGEKEFPDRRPDKPLNQEAGPNTWIHKSDILGPFHLSMPLTGSFDLRFGVDGESLRTKVLQAAKAKAELQTPGYRFQAELPDASRLSLKIYRNNQVVSSKELRLKQLTETNEEGEESVVPHELELVREHRFIVIKLDGKEALAWADSEPLHGYCLAMSHDGTIDFESVTVQREHVKDYLFEKAATDWQRQGIWEVTNRFSCDPRWSHMNGRSKGLAAFWNKNEFEGDFTVEFYAGMRMRQEDMRVGVGWYYPRVGDINLTISGDGTNVFSGYSIVHAAWDSRWSETHTRIYRGKEIVAETDKEFVPSVRKGLPRTRPIPVDWDPGGRVIHGAWYYIKVRRTGNRLDWFFDNVPVLSYEDPNPLTGKRLALWTQDNSIVIACAKIAYTQPPQPAIMRIDRGTQPIIEEKEFRQGVELASEASPTFRIGSDTHPYLECEFEKSLNGWKQAGDEQSAFLTLDTRKKVSGRSSLKLTNMQIGGDFGAEISADNLNLLRVNELSFDYRIPTGVYVNLYFSLRHDPHTRYFVRLTGSDLSRRWLMKVGDFEAVQDSKWHRATIDISRAIKRAVPRMNEAIVDSMQIGNFHDGYMTTGIGGNPAGLSYHLDGFRILGSGPGPAEFAFQPVEGSEITKFKWVVDKRPSTDASKSRGATETSIMPVKIQESAADDWRALRKAIKTEATKTDKPASSKEKFVTRHLALPNPVDLTLGEHYLHVSALGQDGDWSKTLHRKILIEPKLSVVSMVPAGGERWRLNPIRTVYNDITSTLQLSSIQMTVNRKTLDLSEENITYNADKRELTLDLNLSGLVFADGEEVALELAFSEFKSQTPDRVAWRYTVDTKHDRTRPSRVSLAERPLDLDFEESIGNLLPYSSDYGAELSLDKTTAASGGQSLKVTNAVFGSYTGFYTTFESLYLGRFPVLSFDYKTDGFHRLDFMLNTSAGKRYIGFTDMENVVKPSKTLDKASQIEVKPDGRWNHAEIDLRHVPDPKGAKNTPMANRMSALYMADFGYRSNVAGSFTHLDNLSILPVVSSKSGVKIEWAATDLSGISGYAVKWSGKPVDEPDRRKMTVESGGVFNSSGESDQYLHICARDKAGNWGPTAHYRYLIDNIPPKVASVLPKHGERSAADRIDIKLEDANSGVALHNLALSLNGESVPLDSEYVTWDAEERTLSWRWVAASIAKKTARPDKMKMNLKLSGIKDYAGNETRPHSWSWVLDHSTDKTAPPAPLLTSKQSWGIYQPFTTGDELAGKHTRSGKYGWRSLVEKEVRVEIVDDPIRKDRCLRAVSSGKGDDSAFRMTGWGVDGMGIGHHHHRQKTFTSFHPHVSFDYRIQPGTHWMLRVYDYLPRKYYFIKLTADAREGNTGVFENIIADGKWHRATIDLHKLLNDVNKTSTNYYIYKFAFGNWSSKPNPPDTEIHIDNFLTTKSNPPKPSLAWTVGDTTGIKGYSTAFDQNPMTEPAKAIKQTENVGTPPIVEKSGLYYFHVRAVDGSGNWGPAAHYPYYVASIPDVSGK